jgi:micrococcal nuclease
MYNYRAKIIGIYDGDTVTAFVDLGFLHFQEMKLRLANIETPEIRGVEKVEGKKVRDILRAMILDKDVEIHTFKDKTGKFGRYLATIYHEGVNINQWLVDNGHAEPY